MASEEPELGLPVRLFLLLSFQRPGYPEDVEQAIVAFVTGEFIKWLVAADHREGNGPGLNPGGGVSHGEFVKQHVFGYPGEAFFQMQIVAGAPKAGLGGKIGGLHHQGFPFPVATWVPMPLADPSRGMSRMS